MISLTWTLRHVISTEHGLEGAMISLSCICCEVVSQPMHVSLLSNQVGRHCWGGPTRRFVTSGMAFQHRSSSSVKSNKPNWNIKTKYFDLIWNLEANAKWKMRNTVTRYTPRSARLLFLTLIDFSFACWYTLYSCWFDADVIRLPYLRGRDDIVWIECQNIAGNSPIKRVINII